MFYPMKLLSSKKRLFCLKKHTICRMGLYHDIYHSTLVTRTSERLGTPYPSVGRLSKSSFVIYFNANLSHLIPDYYQSFRHSLKIIAKTSSQHSSR